MKFYCEKVDGVLIAADEQSREKLANLGLDALVECSTKEGRNLRNHKRFFAFLKTCFEMQEEFTDLERFREFLTIRAGHYIIVAKDKGITYLAPKSIAFDQMEEGDFKLFFKSGIDAFIKWMAEDKTRPPLSEQQFMAILDYD